MRSIIYKRMLKNNSRGLRIWPDAPAPPKSSNAGELAAGSFAGRAISIPRLVTRGESYQVDEIIGNDGDSYILVSGSSHPKLIHISRPKVDGVANAAIIDWLNCSFSITPKFSIDAFFGQLLKILGTGFSPAKDREKGLHGYSKSFELGKSGAYFAFGGNSHTGFVTFSGEACHQIPDWKALVNYFAIELNGRITRVDLAFDDFDGVHTVNNALRMYQEGLFTNGGREPLLNQAGNWVKPDGRGRTLYIGNAKNGKLLRVYEKGMQLGAPFHPWVRWELQLGNKDRDIPWETIFEPGKYLAGSYPNALGWISDEQSRIKTLKTTASISYRALIAHGSSGYGKLIDLMLKIEGSPEKVVDILRRDGIPARLDLPSIPNHGKVMP